MADFPGIQEVDEYDTSGRYDSTERLQTEYSEDDTVEQLSFIKQELFKWVETGTALLCSFLYLSFYEPLKLPVEIALIPLMLLDIKTIITKYLGYKKTEMYF